MDSKLSPRIDDVRPRSTTSNQAGLVSPSNATRSELGGGELRIGGIGLGVGTIASYGECGDYLRFYEINPTAVD